MAHDKAGKRINSDKVFTAGVYIICALVFLTVAYPLYFVIIASVSNPLLVAKGQVVFLPQGINFFGYREVMSNSMIWTGFRNTAFYTVAGTAFKMLITLPAAYALSRDDMRGRKVIMLFMTFVMFFSGGLIPTYVLINNIGLTDSVWVFIIPFAVNVYNLIIARTFFENSIPKEMYEAASLDGCNDFKFFIKIVLPLSKAIVSVIMLYYLVAQWNDFFTGLIYIRTNALYPLQLVLRDILIANNVFSGGTGSLGAYDQMYAETVKYAVIIISSLPMLIIYPFIQKYFEKGVMIGAIKG